MTEHKRPTAEDEELRRRHWEEAWRYFQWQESHRNPNRWEAAKGKHPPKEPPVTPPEGWR